MDWIVWKRFREMIIVVYYFFKVYFNLYVILIGDLL